MKSADRAGTTHQGPIRQKKTVDSAINANKIGTNRLTLLTGDTGIRLLVSKWESVPVRGSELMFLNRQRFTFICTVVFLSMTFVSGLMGQDYFDGGTSNPGDWNDPANWNNDTLPGAGNNVIVGGANVSPATAEISGPLTNPTIADLRLGAEGAGGFQGTVNHSAGSLTATGWVFVGLDAATGNPGNVGTYNLSGTGSFTVDLAANNGEQEFHVGLGGGSGSSNQGVVTVADEASLTFPRGYIGSNDGNQGTLTQTGGSVLANDWVSVGRDGGATGTYNMSGGTLTVNNDGLSVGENNGTTGMMNVSGLSTISTPLLNIGRFGGGAVGSFNVTGSAASISATSALNVGGDGGSARDATGIISFVADGGGVAPILAGDVFLNDGTGMGAANLTVDMTLAPAGDILLIDVGGTLTGGFAGLAEGDPVANSGGRFITYTYGDGNDIALVVPEPTALMFVALALLGLGSRRTQISIRLRLVACHALACFD